ncbi:MAG: short chain dehydrogenase, partial [Pseudomonadota bacterium]
GLDSVSDGGSFTLTSGVLDRDPIRMGTNAATANGALAGFVKSAAIELPRGLRVNVVSPGLLDVSAPRYGEWFHGHKPVSSHDVGLAYAKSVEGALTGQVIIVD